MNKLMMKAKAGVTLVELLVVILIVTILSVSLLPLLKPYIEKAKYAAEPIPVIANLQTKVELYQYEKSVLPGQLSTYGGSAPNCYTWFLENSGGNKSYQPEGFATVGQRAASGHFQHLTDTDWQDLTGKNMRPSDFQYAVTRNEKNGTYCYAVGVFGGHDNSGLAMGTGYAVCKVVHLPTSNKVVAVWERYKPDGSNTTNMSFKVTSGLAASPTDGGNYVYIPTAVGDNIGAWNTITQTLYHAGWQF